MSDESKKQDQPPGRPPWAHPPRLSAICPGDFGLAAAYWTGNEGDPATFKAIVGWTTVTNYYEQAQHGIVFLPVVVGDRGFPLPADSVPGPRYIGNYPTGTTSEDAIDIFKKRMAPTPKQAGPGPQYGGN